VIRNPIKFKAPVCTPDAISGHSRNSFDHFVGDGAQAGRYCVDCGFDSACLGAITVIAHIVRRPDNRFNISRSRVFLSIQRVSRGRGNYTGSGIALICL
jgi:hypothetical protein